ncbi:EcsC family protein [Synechococcus sp. CCY 9618]|uniref:EcsC family protein n=1 Tax=Synechococcus sp. CCY 9618 TaxID=2815602 RepID=UPI001C230603|nr:EcsC family protein [Synechococcus sp. CCY 9618]
MASVPGSPLPVEELVRRLVLWGVEGAPLPSPLPGGAPIRLRSAAEVAGDYGPRIAQVGLERAVQEMIEDQARWNGGTGFLTGLGGFALLPVQLPAAVTATWVIQTRLVAAIAALHGFDLEHEAVRTQILLTLIGEEAGEVLKQIGVKASQQFAQAQLRRLPAGVLAAINRAVGFRLVSRFGEGGLVRLHRVVPVLGGLVGGGVDYVMTRRLGAFAARELGRRVPASWTEADVIDVEVIG